MDEAVGGAGEDSADVIPIGTRGRPGRGRGQGKPSAASRSLAGSAKSGAKKSPRGASGKSTAKAGAAGAPTAQNEAEQTAPVLPLDPPDISFLTPPLLQPQDLASQGIPVGEWIDAVVAAAQEVFGMDWERHLAELLAFLRRRLTGDYTVDAFGFDEELTKRFLLAVLRPIAQKWFRIEVRGIENIPESGGGLVVSNHSGTIPMDGLMTMSVLHDHTDRHLRALGADLVFSLPIVSDLARSLGATLACQEDAERMLSAGELVGVWPEGFKGIGKPFSERYKLQRFGRGGFVSAAIRSGVPIIPVSVVGAEEIYPLIGDIPWLARLLRVPYIPITPTFPWLGPLGLVPLPSKWLIEFGEPIRTDDFDPSMADDPMLLFSLTDQVRESIQQNLYDLLRQRRSVFGGLVSESRSDQ